MLVEEEVGVSLALETPNSTSDLIELAETKSIRSLDDDGVAIGNIETGLDDGSAD